MTEHEHGHEEPDVHGHDTDGQDTDGQDTDWQDTLRATGHRLTAQRELVLRAVETLSHATPDEVFAEVRRHSSAVNLSTVYRTLDLLDEIGLIKHAHIEERTPTYHSTRGHEHFHLVCHRCRAVLSVGSEKASGLTAFAASDHGFAVDVGHLTVFGVCASCQEADLEGNPAAT